MRRVRSRPAAAVSAALALVAALAIPAQAHHLVPRPTDAACPPDRVSSPAQIGYRDVAGSVFERDIACISDYRVALGRPDGLYLPGAPVARRHMALFLTRLVSLAGVPLPSDPAGFSDIAGLDPDTRRAVDAVAGLGITRGTSGGRFAPDGLVSREQMASFLARAHEVMAGPALTSTGDHFADDTGSPHEQAINAVASTGIAAGTVVGGSHTFSPGAAVTRGQMAGFLARTLAVEVEAGVVRSAWESGPAREPQPGPQPAPEPPSTSQHLTADGEVCTLVGTAGDDVLRGTSEADVLCGLDGQDVLEGLDGPDVLDGGEGEDRLDGGTGDDDLDGGLGPDVLDGGLGDNFCVPAENDVLQRCRYDETPPELVEGSVVVTPAVIDVSDGDVPFTVDVRLRDDVGLGQLQWAYLTQDGAYGAPTVSTGERVSGTVRDGVWRFHGVAPQYTGRGSYGLYLYLVDRVGRDADYRVPDVLTLHSDIIDTQPPVVQDAAVVFDPDRSPVDVRTSSASVTMTARITDDLSGVSGSPYLCLARFDGTLFTGSLPCGHVHRISGDALDGVYQGTIVVPQGSGSGDWSVSTWVRDRARGPNNHEYWVSPAQYEAQRAEYGLPPDSRVLPGGIGDFTVLGQEDPVPPEVTAVSLTPERVDTLYGPQTVLVTVDATDPDGGGIRKMGARLSSAEGQDDLFFSTEERSAPTVGTPSDGRWTFEITLPRGTPPGTYHLELWLSDSSHWRLHVAPGHRHEGMDWAQTLPGPAEVVVEPVAP